MEVIKVLLKHVANPTLQDANGKTPYGLIYAWSDREKAVKLIGAPYSPFLQVCGMWSGSYSKDNLEEVKSALEKLQMKGYDVNVQDDDGRTGLHFATEEGNKKVTEFLLEKGAYVDAVDKDCRTALHIASCRGQNKIVHVLFQNGANINAR